MVLLLLLLFVRSSSLIPSTGYSLSEDLGATYSFILTEYDLDLRFLSSSYAGLKVSKKSEKVGESRRRLEKVGEGWRRSEKVEEGWRRLEKVESRRLKKVGEG